jgi:hypothetical protein
LMGMFTRLILRKPFQVARAAAAIATVSSRQSSVFSRKSSVIGRSRRSSVAVFGLQP